MIDPSVNVNHELMMKMMLAYRGIVSSPKARAMRVCCVCGKEFEAYGKKYCRDEACALKYLKRKT